MTHSTLSTTMKHSTFQAVWFDLDGTLLDTSGDLVSAINTTLATYNYPTAPPERIRANISFGSRVMFAAALGCQPNDLRIDAMLAPFQSMYRAHLTEHTRWFDGMESIINALEAEHIPWGIITNKAERFAIPLIRAFNLTDRIAVLVCGNTLDESKPSPKPLIYACQQTGYDPTRCVYIGDSPTDIIAGKGAGMYTIACAYGYLPTQSTPEMWGADAIIDAPVALRPLLWQYTDTEE